MIVEKKGRLEAARCARGWTQKALARESGNPRGANMVLLGMAADRRGIVSPGELREAVARIFAPKGEDVVLANQAAFDLGMRAAGK